MPEDDDIWSDEARAFEGDVGYLYDESGYTDAVGDPYGLQSHVMAKEAYMRRQSHEFEQWQKMQSLRNLNREEIILSFLEFMGSPEASGYKEHGTSNLAKPQEEFEELAREKGVEFARETIDEYIEWITNLGYSKATAERIVQVKEIALEFLGDVEEAVAPPTTWMSASLQMKEVKRLLENTFKGKTLFSKQDAEAVRQLIYKRTVMEQIQSTINDLLEEKFRRFERVLDENYNNVIQYYQSLLNIGHTLETSSRFVRMNIDRQVGGVKRFLHTERVAVGGNVVDMYTSGLMERLTTLISRSRTLLEKIDNELMISFADIEVLLTVLNVSVKNNTLGKFSLTGDQDAVLLDVLGRCQALLVEVRAFSKEVFDVINVTRKTGLETYSYSRESEEFMTGEFSENFNRYRRNSGLTEWEQWSEGSSRSGGMWAEDITQIGGSITLESTGKQDVGTGWESGLLFSLVSIDLEKVIEQISAYMNRTHFVETHNPDIDSIKEFMDKRASGGIELRKRTAKSYFTARAEVGSKNEVRYLFGLSDNLTRDLEMLGVSHSTRNDIIMAVDEAVFGRPNLEVQVADLVEERVLSKFKGVI